MEVEMDNSGWIKLYRKFLTWEWYTTPNMVHIFIYLLLSANHEKGKWKGIEVERGQLVTGLLSIKKNTGVSVQSTRTCLERLKSTGEITIKSTNKYSIITVCNYESYQSMELLNNKQINNHTNKQLTNNQQTTNNKQEYKKEEKKEKEKEKEIFSISNSESQEGKAYNEIDFSQVPRNEERDLSFLDDYGDDYVDPRDKQPEGF
jgi:hypothetical protein